MVNLLLSTRRFDAIGSRSARESRSLAALARVIDIDLMLGREWKPQVDGKISEP